MRYGKFGLGIAIAAMGIMSGYAAQRGENPGGPDPYLWLSDIQGKKPLAWVKDQTDKTNAALKPQAFYKETYQQILTALNAPDRIAYGNLSHQWVFNFWQDKAHVRGVWRRASIASYNTGKPEWKTLFDVDAWNRKLGKEWVWNGSDCNDALTHCLLFLSPGGGDALEIREFDVTTQRFLDKGFALPMAKSSAQFIDENTVLFATDFGKGTMTTSSYPRIVKMWKRGQKIADARVVYSGKPSDVWAQLAVFHGPSGTVPIIIRGLTFFTAEFFYVKADGKTVKLPLPIGADLKGVTRGQLVATLRNAWTPHGQKKIGQGSLIAFDLNTFIATGKLPKVAVLATPDSHGTIDSVAPGRDAVFAAEFENVTGSVHVYGFDKGAWNETVLDLPKGGSAQIVSSNDFGPEAYLTFESFLTPPTLYAYDGKAVKAIKSLPARFDASTMTSEQFWATSKDGTKIPYFVIKRKDAKGPIPTILYSYGGFELALTPWYWNDGHRPIEAGEAWIAKGGAMVVANIRGGGEFGPAWHQAALKYNHAKAFEDFEAVARDIIAKKLTTPKQLGIVGASNGGLLVTATMVKAPDLFSAVVCQRPLIDMVRYTQFGAGASWVDEYGDPADPKMRAYIETYSPYQLVKKDVKYPAQLYITETTDDRVTPVFARMMAAKTEAQGHDVLFHESAEGGHGPGSTNAAQAEMWALSYTFFANKLGLTKK